MRPWNTRLPRAFKKVSQNGKLECESEASGDGRLSDQASRAGTDRRTEHTVVRRATRAAAWRRISACRCASALSTSARGIATRRRRGVSCREPRSCHRSTTRDRAVRHSPSTISLMARAKAGTSMIGLRHNTHEHTRTRTHAHAHARTRTHRRVERKVHRY